MFHFGFFGNDLSNIMGVQKPWTSCFIWLVSLRGLNSDSGRRGFGTLHNRLLGWHCTHCAHKHGCHIPKRWRCLQKSCASASFRTIETVFMELAVLLDKKSVVPKYIIKDLWIDLQVLLYSSEYCTARTAAFCLYQPARDGPTIIYVFFFSA